MKKKRLVRADTLFRDFSQLIRNQMQCGIFTPTSAESIIQNNLVEMINVRYDEVAAHLKHLLFEQCHIHQHLQRLRWVYFMEDGQAMDRFAKFLFKKVCTSLH